MRHIKNRNLLSNKKQKVQHNNLFITIKVKKYLIIARALNIIERNLAALLDWPRLLAVMRRAAEGAAGWVLNSVSAFTLVYSLFAEAPKVKKIVEQSKSKNIFWIQSRTCLFIQ